MMPPANGTPPLNKKHLQQGHSEDDNDAHSPEPTTSESKKRRAPGSSARGVANLTPEQLAKKRANDREAQRAIRERTKNQIENLEARIRELSSTQPFQELQHALKQKEAVEAENADIKKRLASVLGIIEPVLATGIRNPNYDPALCQTSLPPRPNHSANHNPNMVSSPMNMSSPNSTANTGQWQAPNAQMTAPERSTYQEQAKMLNQQRRALAHGLDIGTEKLGLEFLLDSAQRRLMTNTNPMNGNNIHHDSLDQSSPMHRRSNSHSSNGRQTDIPMGNTGSGEMEAHSAPIRNCSPTIPLDHILLACLHERQQQVQEGIPTSKLVGPSYPSVSALLNHSQAANAHPLSKVFTDILSTFPDLSTLPERLAVLYIMFLLMRWQISPTQENYDRLPDWMTPRPSQLFTPHPAWIDHLPWPRMRDKLVREYPHYQFDHFFVPFTTTLSLNWPYEDTDTILNVGPGGVDGTGDELTINPVFERHLMRLENWSLGPAFAAAFPGLRDAYRLKGAEER